MRIPRILLDLSTFWGLSSSQTSHIWRALEQTNWSRPAGWKRALAAHGQIRVPLRAVLGDPRYAPYTVVNVVESLVREQRLTRAAAVPIEEHILAKVTDTGQWRGMPTAVLPPLEMMGSDIIYAVQDYWR
jgi:hypothetical protein